MAELVARGVPARARISHLLIYPDQQTAFRACRQLLEGRKQ